MRHRGDTPAPVPAASAKRAAVWPARVACGIWLAALALLFVIDKSWVPVGLLGASVVCIVASIALGALSGANLQAQVELPGRGVKNEPIPVTVLLDNRSALPVWRGWVNVEVDNPLTAEHAVHALPFAALPLSTLRLPFELESPYCGKLSVSCAGAQVNDVFGIVRRSRDLQGGGQVSIAPAAGGMLLHESGARAHDIESFTYAPDRPGDDPGETFAVREYQPGDSVRRIHWKLTEKLDETMLRESSFPIYSSLLVLVETAWYPEELAPKMADAQMEALACIMQALLESGVAFELAFVDHQSGSVITERIVDAAGMWAGIGLLLAAPRVESETSSVQAFLEAHPDTVWARVAYLTAGSAGADADRLVAEGGVLTTLRCVPYASAPGLFDEQTELTFTAENWQSELAGVEL